MLYLFFSKGFWIIFFSIYRKNYQVHVFVVIHKISKIANFTRNSLKNDNDSEHAVKRKNAPFFMNFPNINKNWQLFSHCIGPFRSSLLEHCWIFVLDIRICPEPEWCLKVDSCRSFKPIIGNWRIPTNYVWQASKQRMGLVFS